MKGIRPFPVNTGPAEPKREIHVLWKAVAIALIRHHNLYEGIWRVDLQFGSPIGVQSDIQTPHGNHQYPAAVVPAVQIVLKRVTEMSDTAVDAAIVNARVDEHVRTVSPVVN